MAVAVSYRDYGFVGFTKAVVLDVETTGLDPTVDRIVAVAAIKVDFAEMARTGHANAETFSALLNPGCPIPAEASAIHGIEDHHVKDAERFCEIAQQLRDFIGDLPIVGHNIQFDKQFLNAEFRRCKVKGLGRTKSYCTQQRTKEHLGYIGKGFRRVSLIEAAQLFEVPGRRGKHHDAMEDAQICLQVAAGYYLVDNGLKHPRLQARARDRTRARPEHTWSLWWAFAILVAAVLLLILAKLA